MAITYIIPKVLEDILKFTKKNKFIDTLRHIAQKECDILLTRV